MKYGRWGFTIVELLIVIVVVAVLAAISVAAYSNISNRAHDSAVKSDLSNLAKAAKLYHAENGHYPERSYFFGSSNSISITKSAYDDDIYNLYYCTEAGERSNFGIAARSKSGQTYTISSTSGIAENTLAPQWQVACGAFGATVLANVEFIYGYNLGTREWMSSIGG